MTYEEEQAGQTPHPPEQSYRGEIAPVMSFSEWLITLLIMIIPILNFIMLVVWVSERNSNPNKVNWAKATLVLIGIQLVLGMFFLGAFIGTFTHMFTSLNQSGLW
jgi:hypothetical protein